LIPRIVPSSLSVRSRQQAFISTSSTQINIGGVAGGDKYIKNGILFKFAMDPG
jgi:hypothetical protein